MKILKSREIKELTPLHSQQVAEREFVPRRRDCESHTHDTKSRALLSHCMNLWFGVHTQTLGHSVMQRTTREQQQREPSPLKSLETDTVPRFSANIH